MIRLTYVYIVSIFIFLLKSNIVIASSAQSEMLKNTLNSIVTVYAVNFNNKRDADSFLKSSVAGGSAGSGVVIDKAGIFITNFHVIDGKSIIKVVLNDGRVFKANLIKSDNNLDLAILKIEDDSNNFIPINMVSSENIEIGDSVFAIGNPFSVGISVSSGIVSALPNNKSGISKIGNLIQTDAPMNPGNSGGALIDINGNLVGINTAIFSKSGTFLGIGFAIPTDVVKLFISKSLNGKKIKQYWLGFSAVNVNAEIAKNYKLKAPKGVIITNIFKDGPADKANLKVGDIILSANKKVINSVNDISFVVASIENEEAIDLQMYSDGKIFYKEIIPQEPTEEVPAQITKLSDGIFRGLVIANNSNAISYELSVQYVENTLVVYDIEKSSILAKLGIKKGDIISSIDGQEIKNVDDLVKLILQDKTKEKYDLVFRRYNTYINVSAKLR